ncbi:MAG: hypothetical protein WDW36_005892 [Sanguina aurantia]
MSGHRQGAVAEESDKLLKDGPSSSGSSIHGSIPAAPARGGMAHSLGSSLHSSLRRTNQNLKKLLNLAPPPPVGLDTSFGEGTGDRPRLCPEEQAGWLSMLFYNYANGLINTGLKKHLEHDDLWDVARWDDAGTVSSVYFANLKATAHPKAPQGVVWKAIFRTHGRLFAIAGAIKLVHDCIMFMSPFLLGRLLKHMGAGGSREVSLGLSFAILGVAVLENATVNVYFHILYRMSLHLKIDMIQLLYEKSVRVTSAVKSDMGVGAIVNLQSNDAAKLWGMPLFLHIVWNGPFQILVVMGMLVNIMSWAPAMAALAVTILLIPLSTLVGKSLAAARKQMLIHIDARVKLCSEIITGIRAIKLYAWEVPYVNRVTTLREKELVQIYRTQLMSSLNTAVFMSGPVLVSLAAFGVRSAMGLPLTAAVAFPSLALFNLLRFPIIMFPSQVMSLINARVGLQRIQKFLEADEMVPAALLPAARRPTGGGVAPPPPAVSISSGTFSWGAAGVEAPVVKDITLEVAAGQLVIIVGQVGSGKSSLLAALLGEMSCAKGKVMVAGTVAYTAQDPWIQNSTLRANVLMGNEYEGTLYTHTLTACAMGPDLEMLPAGDASEIGEKGINLSGGQKHRVALARAVYANADVYLLDDPLSAVDAHVGRVLFDECICGLLADKTRLLVTHQLQYLPAADLIVVMSEGRIQDMGTYEGLTSKGVNFHNFVAADKADAAAGPPKTPAPPTAAAHAPPVDHSSSTPATAAAAPHGAPAANSNGHAAAERSDSSSDAGSLPESDPLLERRGRSHDSDRETKKAGFEAVAEDGTGLELAKGRLGKNANGVEHSVDSVSRLEGERVKLLATLSLKEKDGKIVKAEERSKGAVKSSVYNAYLSSWSSYYILPICMIVASLGERGLQIGQNFELASWANDTADAEANHRPPRTRLFLQVYLILGLLSMGIQVTRSLLMVSGSIKASRKLQRELLTKVVRLPMSFFDSQPTGRLLNRFTKDTEAVDINVSSSVNSALSTFVSAAMSVVVVIVVSPLVTIALFPLGFMYHRVQKLYIASTRELKRLDSVAFSPIFQHFNESLTGLITIRAFRKQHQFTKKNRDSLNHSNRAYWPIQVVNRWLSVRLELMGACVVFLAAVTVSVVLPRNSGLAGLAITSALNLTGIMNWMVRQVTELEVSMNSVERLIEYNTLDEEALPVIEGSRPPTSWPTAGAIVVSNLEVRYRPELEPVLQGLSFSVRPCEKIGVCGRTGCGKSTLMMALYRIVEPCGGSIRIDGIDVATIGLRDLRSRLSLVPQDPVIFSGTVRSNLDPFQEVPHDKDIWEALTRAGIDAFVRELEAGLDAPLKEGGSNLSTGQRQLLCMARALLRRSRILVLDEATSNVDNATDALIQRTIRTAFKDCTVLTIAHRLHTIVDSDRILLLDGGRLGEFDSPSRLLATPGSAFRALVEETTKDGGVAADLVANALAGANGSAEDMANAGVTGYGSK